jgi:signal peptidase I
VTLARSERPRTAAPSGAKSEALEWLKTLALTIVFLIVIRSFLVQTFVITSGSMEDTLLVGDFLMVNRLALGTRLPGTEISTPGYSEPRRGEVVVFDPPHEEDIKLVKRLVGMPGDTLEMRAKNFFINGELQDEPYALWRDPMGDDEDPSMVWQLDHLVSDVDRSSYVPTRDTWGPIVVPEGHYFMLGDNRDYSLDSRYWGLVERWRLEGKAMFFYFSYNRESRAPFAFFREVRWDRIWNRIR